MKNEFVHICWPQDIYIVFDGGKEGLKSNLMSGFVGTDGKQMIKAVRPVMIQLEESAMEARQDLARGFSTINQFERMYLVTRNGLNLTYHKRKHFPASSNRGNHLGPVAPVDWFGDGAWRAPPKVKKEILGRAGKILCGGKAPLEKLTEAEVLSAKEEEQKDKKEKPKGLDKEDVVFFHALPIVVHEGINQTE